MASRSISNHNTGPFITSNSVVEALQTLNEARGSSLTTLKKYFRANVPAGLKDVDIKRQIKLAVGKGILENKFEKQGRKLTLIISEDKDGSKMRHLRNDADGDDDSRRSRSRRVRRSLRRRRRRRRRRSKRRGRSKKRKSKRRSLRRRRRGKSALRKKRSRARKIRRSSRRARRLTRRKRRSSRSIRRRRR